ncbi:MAG TPA: hypothetical protein DDZ67_14610 [Xanthomonadaceae bacterium]|nr:hypothetical protein [Xanthomonadaceae bacterium]
MIDSRIEKVDLALGALGPEQLSRKAALWQWAYREMLHETLTGMHQLSHVVGIAEQVADVWREPVDVIEPERPYMERAALADRRLPQVRDGLGDAGDAGDRVRLWRLGYANLIAATLQGMHALAGKHRIERHTAAAWWN